jgi:SP family sugar:H+ symporter-like MFS transporter
LGNNLPKKDFWIQLFAMETDTVGNEVVTASQQALIVSILSVGTFFDALLGASIGDWIGRRWGILLACAAFTTGVVLQTIVTAIPMFVGGRCIAGAGVGLISTLILL